MHIYLSSSLIGFLNDKLFLVNLGSCLSLLWDFSCTLVILIAVLAEDRPS